jgi:MYXO-CTERM domain-containing protein
MMRGRIPRRIYKTPARNSRNCCGGILTAFASVAARPGGSGTANISGGSSLTITGQNNQLIVGTNGTGTLTIAGGSSVNVASGNGSAGQTIVGNTGSTGTVTVAGGSTLNAGSLLGIAATAGGNTTGTGSVLLTGNSTLNATSIVVGANGTLGGNGTINGNVTNNGGTLKVGASPDPLHIGGDYTQKGGTIKLEIDSDGHGGFLTDSLVFDKHGAVVNLSDLTIDFSFGHGASAKQFLKSGLFNLDTFLLENDGSGTDVPLPSIDSPLSASDLQDITYTADSPDFSITDLAFNTDGGALSLNEVPEPSGALVLLPGLAGLALLRRRRTKIAD